MQREVILIFGQPGSGKSYMAAQIVREWPRVLILESGYPDFPAIRKDTFLDTVDYLAACHAFESPHYPFRVAYTPRSNEHEICFQLSLELKNHLLVLEEGDRFDDTRIFPEYDEIATRGRHEGINIMAIALHPHKLPKDIRRQASRVISFRQHDADDIDSIAEIVGEEAYKLPTLSGPPAPAPHPYLEWTLQTGAVFKGIGDLTNKDIGVNIQAG